MSRHTRQVGILGAAALLWSVSALPSGAVAPPAPAPTAEAPARVEPRFAWRRIAEGGHGEAVSALAIDRRAARLALGDGRGVRIADDAGGFRPLLRRGPVRDLAFLPQGLAGPGALLAATDDGLYLVAPEGARLVAPAPGSGGRVVHRISVAEAGVVVASDAGAYLSEDGRRWQRLSARLPLEPASAVALRPASGGLECLAVVGRRLWRVALAASGAGWTDTVVSREAIPFATAGDGPVDVLFDTAGADAVVVFPSSFAVRAARGEGWRRVRPALPPGIRARRLHAAHGLLWLATDRGLLVARSLGGPWERAARPAGTADVHAVTSDPASVYVAAGEQVLRAQPVVVAAAGERRAPADAARLDGERHAGAGWRLRTPEGDPPIEQVHRAALAYLELGPRRMAGLWSGAGRRGWLPVVSLRLVQGRDEDRGTDFDQSFTSGEVRHLVDRERGSSRDFEASLTFSWDLGDVAYHPERIDVSREAREVIKLRDDVLDEVTQLYFERRRVLAELGARPSAPSAEALRLRLRAAELAAGIDAWTGGWFTRARAAALP